ETWREVRERRGTVVARPVRRRRAEFTVERERLGAPDIRQRIGIQTGTRRIGDLEHEREGDYAEQHRCEPAGKRESPVGHTRRLAQNSAPGASAPIIARL